jgi:GLPGLI family protein
MKKISGKILLFITPLILMSSCSNMEPAVSEGIITYDISYPRPIEDKWMETLMPKEMEMQFKNNKINTELTFGLGMIKIGYITNTEEKNLHEMLKFMKKRNVSHRSIKEVDDLLKRIPYHKIELLPDTKSIAGYLCYKATVKIENPANPYNIYDLWYTKDIEIKEPNWCTPFKSIPGVLMEYRIERFNVIMHFTAVEVEKSEINDTEFLVPKKYKEISVDAMEKSLLRLKEI